MQQCDDEALRAPAQKAREPKAKDAERPADPLRLMQQSAGNRAVAQLLSGGVPDDDPAAALDKGLGSPGSALPGEVQRDMEGALDADLSSVRLHTGAEADQSARGLGARAYTVGEDVVLGNDVGSPSSEDGKRTLAHELTHVIQQRSGAVEGTDVGGGVSVSDPSDRFEQAAEAAAAAAVATHAGATGAQQAPSVQREVVPEEEQEEAAAVTPSMLEEEEAQEASS